MERSLGVLDNTEVQADTVFGISSQSRGWQTVERRHHPELGMVQGIYGPIESIAAIRCFCFFS